MLKEKQEKQEKLEIKNRKKLQIWRVDISNNAHQYVHKMILRITKSSVKKREEKTNIFLKKMMNIKIHNEKDEWLRV